MTPVTNADLSAAMHARTADWCTFATWASRQAGNTIRGEDLLDAFERASARVAEGNLKVFAEIGREFARFMAAVPIDARVDLPEFLAFAAGLRPGPPPDGQDLPDSLD